VHVHVCTQLLLPLQLLQAAVSSTPSDGAAATNADTREAVLKGVFSRAAQQLVKHATATAAASAADETAEATQVSPHTCQLLLTDSVQTYL
jgi:response regulator of citrate/malate metabolism